MSDATCRICGRHYSARGLTRHLQSCLKKNAAPQKTGIHLKVSDAYDPTYWLQIIVNPDATLDDLDAFLRSTWLECCGHMSEFEIIEGGRGNRLAQALPDAAEFSYIYDFGSSTYLKGRSYGRAPWPSELSLDSPESSAKVLLLSRNPAPLFDCKVCGKAARWVCSECGWNAQAYFCDKHAQTHHCDAYALLPVVNSPRMGVCAYDGDTGGPEFQWEPPGDLDAQPQLPALKLLDQLFETPPTNEDELTFRISQTDVDALRVAMIDRLERGDVDIDDTGWVGGFFEIVGLSDQKERVRAALTDPEVQQVYRHIALLALSADESTDIEQLLEDFGDEDMSAVFAGSLETILSGAADESDQFLPIADLLMKTRLDQHETMFTLVDETRQKLGLDAGLIYISAFGSHDYEPIWPLLGRGIVADGLGSDARELEEAADDADSPEVERALRRQALKLRTASMAGDRQVKGLGYFGTCDGAGGYTIFIARENPDASYSIINLLFRTTGALRDGFATRIESRARLEDIREQMSIQAGSDLLEVPIEVAAALADERLQQTLMTGDRPDDVGSLIERLGRIPKASDLPVQPAPAEYKISLKHARKLLAQPQYSSWFLDRTELSDAGIKLPTQMRRMPDNRWIEDALKKLSRAQIMVNRAASLAEHIALWHTLAHHDERAAEFARLAEMTREAPAKSPLLRVLLENGLHALQEQERFQHDSAPIAELAAAAHAPHLRREMRHRFFADLKRPTGAHVVRLTLYCLSFVLLESLQPMIEDSRQPRPERLYDLSFAIGNFIADSSIVPGMHEVLPIQIMQTLAAEGLEPTDLARFMPAFLMPLTDYMNTATPQEFRDAMEAPQAPMSTAFYG